MLRQMGFETGTNGNAIVAGQAGNPDSMSIVSVTAGGTNTYDNTWSSHGGMSCKISAPSSGDKANIGWDSWNTTILTYSLYLRWPAAVSGLMDLSVMRNATAPAGKLQTSSDRKIRVVSQTGTLTTMATALTLDATYRIEWSTLVGATTGKVACNIYEGDSENALESYVSGSTNTGSTNILQCYTGFLTSGVTGSIYVDSMQAQDSAEVLGPWAESCFQRTDSNTWIPRLFTMSRDGGLWV